MADKKILEVTYKFRVLKPSIEGYHTDFSETDKLNVFDMMKEHFFDVFEWKEQYLKCVGIETNVIVRPYEDGEELRYDLPLVFVCGAGELELPSDGKFTVLSSEFNKDGTVKIEVWFNKGNISVEGPLNKENFDKTCFAELDYIDYEEFIKEEANNK